MVSLSATQMKKSLENGNWTLDRTNGTPFGFQAFKFSIVTYFFNFFTHQMVLSYSPIIELKRALQITNQLVQTKIINKIFME